MKKQVTKIICAATAAVLSVGISAAAVGCSPYNSIQPLDYTSSSEAAVSNGGFAVEKGGYIYFINGSESNTAENNYGSVVKGAIMRISEKDLDEYNYSAAETVVPQIAYSSNYQTGLFIYGDYVYYGTPSAKRNSNGEIQNSKLELKSARLDGTDSMKSAYVTLDALDCDYRFVKSGDDIYILYVVTSETLYDESQGVTNLHSYNVTSGVDTLLAYNISGYVFDAEDKTNPRVYYTMAVYDYSGDTNTEQSYNQLYTVTAEKTQPNEYDFDSIFGWNDETDRYINCGDLVFDGIGGKILDKLPFNYEPDKSDVRNQLGYSYTLETYRHGTVFYTRSDTTGGSTYLFGLKEAEVTDGWDAINKNPSSEAAIVSDGTGADSYLFAFKENGDLEAVISAESAGGISINKMQSGKLAEKINRSSYYRIVGEGTATLLFIDGDYLYYSLSGGNGYTFYRIDYTGEWQDYEGMHPDDEVSDFTSVRILDLDAATDWFRPELINGHLLFAGETDKMSSYNYVMEFGVGDMTNADIDSLNKLFESVTGDDGIIAGYEDSDDYPTAIYANLANAARYLFYTADIDYVKDLAAALNEGLDENEDPVYSENTLDKLADLLSCENDWAEFKEYKRTVNGEEICADRRDYYYSVIGEMTDADKESYIGEFRSQYLQEWPEEEVETGWYDGLSTTAKVFFIIGMCLAGIIVIALVVTIVMLIKKKRGNKLPDYSKRRIRVDTTDDKSIDVYADESEPSEPSENAEETPEENS